MKFARSKTKTKNNGGESPLYITTMKPTHITIRMTPEFKEMARKKADKAGQKLSTYIKTLIEKS